MNRGKFITLEGCEGVGKTTNIRFVETYLRDKHIPVVVTREPGSTPLAERIRDLLVGLSDEPMSVQTELLLVFAARAQHIQQVIEPALAQGKWVVSDRFTDATYAYQGGGRKISMATIQWLENLVQEDLRPDLTLLLDAPVNVGIDRARERGAADRFEAERMDFFKRIRIAYLRQAQNNHERIKVIQANQPLAAVQRAIADVLQTLFI